MANVYGFNSEEIARELKRQGEEGLQVDPSNMDATGNETIIIKCGEAVTPRNGLDVSGPFAGDVVYFGSGGLNLTDQLDDVEFYNLTDTSYEELDVVTLTRWRELWVIVGGSGGSAPKRVKFKINDTFLREGTEMSGYANATVIDPMNSDKYINEQIVVWDYKQQFVTTKAGAIGIAIFQAPYLVEEQWHVEECEMLVNTIEATISGSLGPWQASQEDPDIIGCTPTSSWPYVIWDTDESYGGNFGKAFNRKRLTASAGKAWLKRLIPDSHLPVPSNTVAPYTLAPISTAWEYTEVEFPTARWCNSYWDSGSSTWKLGGGIGGSPSVPIPIAPQYAEGFDPILHASFGIGNSAMPPELVWNELTGSGLDCGIKDGTLGWAFLDDNVGEYVTLMSASALFGVPTKVNMVAKKDATSTDILIKPKTGECGVVEYEHLMNVLVWGNEQAGSDSCRMTQEDPLPWFDVFENAQDEEVITGISVDVNGDLEMTKTTIKACTSPADPDTLTLSTMDVVNDVYCSGNSLTKNYQQVKFLGSVLGTSTGVSIDTSCVEIDYTQIIYPTFPYIDYYDIIWPAGCEPCPEPTGCCTATAYPTGQDGITQAACEAETGYISWTQGTCGSGESSCLSGCTYCSGPTELSVFAVAWDDSVGYGGYADSQISISGNGSCGWTVTGTLHSYDPAVNPTAFTCQVTMNNANTMDLSWSPAVFDGQTMPTTVAGYFGNCNETFGLSAAGVSPTDPSATGTWDEVTLTLSLCTP